MSLLSPTETVACCSPLLKQPLGAQEAERIAPLLKALADPVRLRLLSWWRRTPTRRRVCAT